MLLTYSLLVVFATAFVATGLWLSLARHCRWFDHPNHRSSHVIPTPKSGGAGFVLAFSTLVAALYLGDVIAVQQLALAGLALVLAGVGFIDDLRPLGIAQRIGTQVLTALGALLLLDPVPPLSFPWGTLEPAWLRIALLLPGLVWLVNLYNFMDGIDGLAASQAVFMLLAAMAVSWWFDPSVWFQGVFWWMGWLAAACVGFLLLNWAPAKIFMGDAGSTYLGLMLFFFAIASMTGGWLSLAQWLILAATFLADSLTTLARRALNREPFWQAHKRHAYQVLQRRLGSHARATLVYIGIDIVLLLPLALLAGAYRQLDWALAVLAYAILIPTAIRAGAGAPLEPETQEERAGPDDRH